MKNFRPLTDGETRILFMRHAEHKKNVVTEQGIQRALAAGKDLKESGVKISVAYSSPAPRALTTALKAIEGYGEMVYIHTESRLADMGVEDPAMIDRLKKAAKDTGLDGDTAFAKVATTGEFLKVMQRRGQEGATAIRLVASCHKAETVLVLSHGVFRIENTILVLKGEEMMDNIDNITTGCQIVELIIKDGELVEENWLESVSVPSVL